MGLHNAGRTRIERGVTRLEAFKHGNVSGVWFDQPADIGRGQLSREVDLPVWGPVYVVFSYRTPIAWWVGGVWSQPQARYSVTTTNHQGVVASAIAQTLQGA